MLRCPNLLTDCVAHLQIIPPYNESELLLKTASGDEKAFAQLFYAYHQQLAEFINLLLPSRLTTMEIIQDSFLIVWQKREELNSIEKFSSWIFIIARNQALNHIKKQISRQKKESSYHQYAIRHAEPTESLETEKDDYDAILQEAINQLPPQQKKVYQLRILENLSYIEIAEAIGISRESVKKYLQLANRSVIQYVRENALQMALIITLKKFL